MAGHNPNRHYRRSIRWHGYDYTQSGAYFYTDERAPLFGKVVNGEMVLNKLGKIVQEKWCRSTDIRAEIALRPDEFVVMSNHIHRIVWIVEAVEVTGRSPLQSAHPRGLAARSLGSFTAGFKSIVTKRINVHRGTPSASVWQRNYYEHIIRTDWALTASRRYIVENPLRRHPDHYNPDAVGPDPHARDLWYIVRGDADCKRHPNRYKWGSEHAKD